MATELTKNQKSKIEKRNKLEQTIGKIIQESELDYSSVMDVLGRLKEVYRDKGNNLLNATAIEKVIETQTRYQR